MERAEYLKLCQFNAVYPKTKKVKYDKWEFYPKSYILSYDKKGNPISTAELQSVNAYQSLIYVRLSEVEELVENEAYF